MIDLVLLLIIIASALFGLMRGLLATVLGVASWLIAGWAAFQFGERAALMLSGAAMQPSVGEYVGGYLLVFIGVRLAMALLGLLLRGMVDATVLLKWPDRLLGLLLGAVRGLLFAVLAVLLLGFTSMPGKPGWQQSQVVPLLQPSADWLRGWLPEPPPLPDIALMDLGKSVLAGDNDGPNEREQGGGLPAMVLKAMGQRQHADDSGPADPAGALPANIDPAQVRPGQPDPTRVEAQGQARPPSR